ncbi:baseplate assembly protein [Escherichia coli]|nr:baseplate assembly protein [Escherichia coli]
MTARYLGMNRSDGLTVTDLEHISQSIGDILRTPVGSRVMRRDYGSLLASMIDQPQTPALELQIKVACYMAVLKWEQHRLGRDIRLSAIYAALHVEGVQRVELAAPLADIVLNNTQASFCTEYRVVTGGSDE